MGYEPRGRPRKASGEKLSKQITIKLKPSQKKIIEREAKRCGMKTSELIRGVLLRVLKERVQEESEAEEPEKEPEEESGGSGPDGSGSDGFESDFSYPKPVPKDFQELTSFLSEAKARARSSEDMIDLGEVLEDFRFQFERWTQKYRKRIRKRGKIKSETRGETKGNLDVEKMTEQITFRVRPKDHAWLKETRAQEDSMEGGLAMWIRVVVTSWTDEGMILKDMDRHLLSKWRDTFERLHEADTPSEMREGIIDLAENIGENIVGMKKIPAYLY